MHCHLDLYPNSLQLLNEVARRNLFTLVVTTSPRAWLATSNVFSGHPNIEVGLGLHPEIVHLKHTERNILMDEIKNVRFVGEVGIDGSMEHKSTLEMQVSIFNDVLNECQLQGGKILSIHSRGATKHTLDLLDKYPQLGTPILHWFSGTEKDLIRAVERGCWFSVGPVMLKSKKGLSLLSNMPLNRILPESDGPFAQIKNIPVMPWQAFDITETIALSFNISIAEARKNMTANLRKLLF